VEPAVRAFALRRDYLPLHPFRISSRIRLARLLIGNFVSRATFTAASWFIPLRCSSYSWAMMASNRCRRLESLNKAAAFLPYLSVRSSSLSSPESTRISSFRPRLQLRFQASRQIRDTVGSGKAEPLGEVGQSRLRMTAAQPGCDRTRHVGIVTLCK
jgi:hypothetical protein